MTHQNEEYKASCILYGVVAKGSCILASHCAKVGNFNDVAKDLLAKIDQQVKSSSSPTASRLTYKDGEYLYHYLRGGDESVIFLCMTDATFPRKHAFQFLDILDKKLKEQFPYQLKSYSKSMPFCMNSEFEPVIGAEIKRANNSIMKNDVSVNLLVKYTSPIRNYVIWIICSKLKCNTNLYYPRVLLLQKVNRATLKKFLHLQKLGLQTQVI